MRTGRPPEAGEPRDQGMHARFSATEMRAVEEARGSESKSEFVRAAVNERVARRRGK